METLSASEAQQRRSENLSTACHSLLLPLICCNKTSLNHLPSINLWALKLFFAFFNSRFIRSSIAIVSPLGQVNLPSGAFNFNHKSI